MNFYGSPILVWLKCGAFATLDANIAVKIPKINSVVKIGGSNILNNYYTSTFGSAQIGGVYYVSLVFDEFLN